MPVEHLQSPDGPIAIRWGGSKAAPFLLWVHGYTLDSSIWQELWDRLPDYRHLALDLPGHGASRPIVHGDGLATFSHAVRFVADAFRINDLIGLSLGAVVCLKAAEAAPDRFARMMLCSPALPGGPEDQESSDCNQALRRMAEQRGIGVWLSDRWLQSPPEIFDGAKTHPALFEAIRDIVRRHRWDELLLRKFDLDDPAMRQGLHDIRTRIRILVGEGDMEAFLRTAELIRREMRNASVGYLAGARHLSVLEQPDGAAAAILSTFI